MKEQGLIEIHLVELHYHVRANTSSVLFDALYKDPTVEEWKN